MNAEPQRLKSPSQAYDEPWSGADRWHAQGGRVVGLFGEYAPRELVLAAGMLPVRLRPGRLLRAGATDLGDRVSARSRHVPDGLRGELSAESLELLSALLAQELDRIASLLIGRDTESHTKLFYVIRELAEDPEYKSLIPPFAFSDMLRLPSRTSAVYNRTRLRELAVVLGEWSAGEIADEALSAAIMAEVHLAEQLRELDSLRAEGRVAGSRAVLAARAATVLSQADAAAAVGACLEHARGLVPAAVSPRVFVTGSEPEPAVLVGLEAAGLALVGDDHGWHHAVTHERAGDPGLDWLADRYQLSPVGAARAGLDRAVHIAGRARAVGADCILQLIAPDDLASGWELAELKNLVPTLPVVSVQVDADQGDETVREIAWRLRSELEHRVSESEGAAHG